MAKQFSIADILRHVMTHEIHHRPAVCLGKRTRNPSCGSKLFQQNVITASPENSIQ
ncbi:DinB family protein [Bacillus sp. HU-1818]|uniref:DinB family protein n=1 Tax=Bacillus sp. HU-1818 TaxID=2704469 RepID=UPI001F5C79EB